MNLEQLENCTLAEIRDSLDAGAVSACELVNAYLERIQALDKTFNAILTLNPDALAIASRLDSERASGTARGPLHGIPILVKDNLDTGDSMATTAGSLALANTRASEDSTVVRKLREAGAVLLGKTNLSEWANFRSRHSSSGWSSLGGQTRNAHDSLRTPGGSSSGSGVAVALGFCAAAIGTETDGSIVIPAAMNGIVGIKPSIGRVSRAGIIPISASQDTAGPMTRTVRDGVILLSAIAGPDARDATTSAAGNPFTDLEESLDSSNLRGKRVGVARAYAGFHEKTDAVLEDAIRVFREAGAKIIDPVELPDTDAIRKHERIVMEYEFRHGLDAYLAQRDEKTQVRTLNDVMAFNTRHADQVMPHFGQDIHVSSASRGSLSDAAYLNARERSLELSARVGIDLATTTHKLDALIAPTTTPAWLIDWECGDNRKGSAATPAAVCGYPHVTVPMGFAGQLPVGLSIFAGAELDREVIQLAHAYETITGHRRAPTSGPR